MHTIITSFRAHRTTVLTGVFAIVFLVAAFAPAIVAYASATTAPMASGSDRFLTDSVFRRLFDQFTALGRWHEASSQINYVPTGDILQSVIAGPAISGQGWGLSIGNGAWIATRWLLNFALGFEFLNVAGEPLDAAAANLAELITTTPLGVIAMLVVIISGLFDMHRRRPGGWRRIVGCALVFGLIAAMGSGAARSTTGGSEEHPIYQPGFLSPGWVVQTANGTVTSLAAGLTSVIRPENIDPSLRKTEHTSPSTLSCSGVMAGLNERVEYAVTLVPADGKVQARMEVLLSDMWSETGLGTYRTVQFGAANPYGAEVFCRGLELKDGASFAAQRALMDAGATALGTQAPTPALGDYNSSNNVYSVDGTANFQATMIAWAACSTPDGGKSWEMKPEWRANYHPKGKDAIGDAGNGLCQKWYEATTSGNMDVPDEFDLPSGVDAPIKVVPSDSADGDTDEILAMRDFIASLSSANWSWFGGGTATAVYALSSFATLTIFGGIALSVVLAKVFAAGLALMLIIVLFVSVFYRDAGARITRVFMQMIGATIFAAVIILILSVVMLLTRLLNAIGTAFTTPGTIPALLWAGIAPVAAFVALSLVMTRLLRLPNPMSLKGGLLWAGAMGGAAGGVMGALTGGRGTASSRAEDAMANAGRAARERAQDYLLGRNRKYAAPAEARHGSHAHALRAGIKDLDRQQAGRVLSAEDELLARQAAGSKGIVGGLVERFSAMRGTHRPLTSADAGAEPNTLGDRAARFVAAIPAAGNAIAGGTREAITKSRQGAAATGHALSGAYAAGRRGLATAKRGAGMLATGAGRAHLANKTVEAKARIADAGHRAWAASRTKLAHGWSAVRHGRSYVHVDPATGAVSARMSRMATIKGTASARRAAIAERAGIALSSSGRPLSTEDRANYQQALREARAERQQAMWESRAAHARRAGDAVTSAALGARRLAQSRAGKAALAGMGVAAAAGTVVATGGVAAPVVAGYAMHRTSKWVRGVKAASDTQLLQRRAAAQAQLDRNLTKYARAERLEQDIADDAAREAAREARAAERAATSTKGGNGESAPASEDNGKEQEGQ